MAKRRYVKGLEVHVPLVIVSYRFLRHCAVYPRGLNALMAKEFLYLLDGHTSCKEVCRTCPAEAVRVDAFHSRRVADTVYEIFQTTAGKAVMGSLTTDKECRVIIRTGFKIVFQVDVSAGIEVCHAFFVSLAEHGYIIFCKRDV